MTRSALPSVSYRLTRLGPSNFILNSTRACTCISSPVMFVVTGLHTKRRPHPGTDQYNPAIRRQGAEKFNRLRAHRRPRPVEPATLSSGQGALPAPEIRMARNNGDTSMEGRRFQIKAPPRIRKFIPKPLILVERVKARQISMNSSSSIASESYQSLTLPKSGMTSPLSAHVTPPTRRIPTCGSLSSDSYLSSSVSIRVYSRNSAVFRSGFGMASRPARPQSIGTLGDSSSSTDTFVADSPCCVKQASCKAPLLVTAPDATGGYLKAGFNLRNQFVSDTGVPVLNDSVAIDFARRFPQSMDAFDPVVTSTPFVQSRTHLSSPMPFITSTVYPPRLRGQTHGFGVASPTSRPAYPFNAPKDAYTVKLPNSGLALPKPAPNIRRLSNRGTSPSPTLVLDGVFALPRSSPEAPTALGRPLKGFARPRKPASRRPFLDTTNASTASLTLSCEGSVPESPRSKLAHVLTTHAGPQTVYLSRKPTGVPPLVRGVEVSVDPRTQVEIEELRARSVVKSGLGACGEIGGGDGSGKGAIERMSFVGVGMVARLRARWETGAAERWGGIDSCA